MSKKTKVVNISPDTPITKATDAEYAKMLKDLLKPFESDFPSYTTIEYLIDFASNAWNLACLSQTMPKDVFKTHVMTNNPLEEPERTILNNMIDLKNKKYAAYDRFVQDVELEEIGNGISFTLSTSDAEMFLESVHEDMLDDLLENDFEENYINRNAIIIKPLQPLLDLANTLYPNSPIDKQDIKESNIYLVNEDIEDIEQWLKKNFDAIFTKELNDWHIDEQDWPKKRSYKMFTQWFQVETSTMVYDMEDMPVSKGF